MGRKPYKNTNLPKGMRARKRGKNTYYYLDTGGKPRNEIPLGKDYTMAVMKWSELTMKKPPSVITFAYVAEKYFEQVVPTKAPRTQLDNHAQLKRLLEFFDSPPAPIDQIEPKHIRLYMDWRVKVSGAKIRANREKSLFSHIWNFAREYGYTKNENPCVGVKSFKEKGRKDIYITNDMLNRVMEAADKPLQFALRLAYITGQRPADVLKMSYTDIKDGHLHVKQNKVDTRLRISVDGSLKKLLGEIEEYKRGIPSNIRTLKILIDENGKALVAHTLRWRFDKARQNAGIDKKLFQFKDLRAKSATDANDKDGIIRAQELLGHTTQNMTVHYIRDRVGKKVSPLE